MSQVKLVKCSACQSLIDIICQIDEKLKQLATNHYKNDVLEINSKYSKTLSYKLISYKNILYKKLFNPSYTDYNQSVLISRIKVLLNG